MEERVQTEVVAHFDVVGQFMHLCQQLKVVNHLKGLMVLAEVAMEGIRVDPTKIDAVRGWTRSTSLTEIQSFVGLGAIIDDLFKVSTIASQLTRQSVRFQ
ncbi:hypothetical protein MTR67_019040 [Solanum verrucosum]|uniref:Uncharacterized protein n=1 Tax=Solanum verrucosum TaxID=315347 RepID=A0AAF0QNE5_SOLVR|nr:hypothetical protein MTR67_019040 [Solanum verrucosum]